MTIAVTGATGQLGRMIIQKLKQKIAPGEIVALARTPSKAAALGVEVREADYEKPETLDRALRGVETLMLVSSSEVGKRASQHANVIAAAKGAGVKRIVYTSLLHADTSPMSLAPEHVQTEAALKTSGIAHTIMRNGWYTENYTVPVPGAVQAGALVGSAGEGRIASATRNDFAEAAVSVLTGDGHDGKVYELAGDEAYTLADLAAEISRQTGKDIPYRNLPQDEYAAVLKGIGVPEGFAGAVAAFDIDASNGALLDDGRQLSALIGRPTTPLSDAVAAALKS
ncbi:SDR family oxidoreductase [Shinella zoogloeoides]|uniref:NAD(P)H-binding protein n=1 Tax=Shinella zoogloeoides TaxID=352475 RepID=A0A6N8TJF3_SHIZO|nr:SDR family oxidoreductase [Shinella zoogloeoides]MXO02565.1 NAD(P)H-binding protein [Shinella zoogloeoides]UEX82209.1 SDR family oxidoreductase [Shinella zoogloeoides]